MTKRRILMIGSNGQLGVDIQATVPNDRWDVVALTRTQLDIRDRRKTTELVGEINPDIVLDLAAVHKTDLCEQEVDLTFEVNVCAASHLARETKKLGAAFVYISTDYVFDGTARSPRVETDRCDPINVYGITKRAGELMVAAATPKHLILRVSGLYGAAGSSGKGGNFVELMLRHACEGKPIRVVDDQTFTPTYTRELAAKIWELLDADVYGIFHCTNDGECSWFDFSTEIFRLAGIRADLSRQSTAESGALARRPAYSVLNNKALKMIGIDTMRPWRDALADYLRAKHGI